MRVRHLTLLLALASCGGSGSELGPADAGPDLGAVDLGEPDTVATPPTVFLPKEALESNEIAVVVNDADPQSGAVGAYYQEQRDIPAENVVHLEFAVGAVLDPADFAPVKAELDAVLGPEIQALALTWAWPYRVGCMSATSAFALGYDTIYCASGCVATAPVDYYDSDSARPFTDLGIRPAMALASATEEDAFDLIDRGVASDGTHPTGDGYFLRTTDANRSVRWQDHIVTVGLFDHVGGLDLQYIDNSSGSGSNVLSDTIDVLFYFTGLANVSGIDTNTYLPGSVADHLTSYGGQIPTGGQMSAQDWLTAGVTASYGTVVEPCNFPQKFPRTSVFVPWYFRGATVVEAYWKSVQWPGQGLFVGEPLARPWAETEVDFDLETLTLTIETNFLDPAKTYEVLSSDAEDGVYRPVGERIRVDDFVRHTIVVENATAPFYRLEEF